MANAPHNPRRPTDGTSDNGSNAGGSTAGGSTASGSTLESFQGLWPMAWPKVGGGGRLGKAIGQDELFRKMCAWDDANYIITAFSSKTDKDLQAKGIKVGFMYNVRQILDDCGGSGKDMIELRARRGIDEIQLDGWEDKGENWKVYPQVHEACGKPEARDDGIFWMERQSFFEHFHTIYVCAKSMNEWIQVGEQQQPPASPSPPSDAASGKGDVQASKESPDPSTLPFAQKKELFDPSPSPESVEIQVLALDGEPVTVCVIPGQTTGSEIGRQLVLAEAEGYILESPVGEMIGMTQETSRVTQDMIDASAGGLWLLVKIDARVRILAGERGNLQNYMPTAPTALLIPGTNLNTKMIPELQKFGAEMGVFSDHDMRDSSEQTGWQGACKVRLYTDITWPGHDDIVCVAVANFPHPRAYSECPEEIQPFSRKNAEGYFDKYRLAMDAVCRHCSHPVDQFAAVPMGTAMTHMKEEDKTFLLSQLVPALRVHINRTMPTKTFDFLCFDEQWVDALRTSGVEVERE